MSHCLSPRLEPAPHVTLSRVKWMSTSSLLQSKRRGTEPHWGSATCGCLPWFFFFLWCSWLIVLEVKCSRTSTFLFIKPCIESYLPSAWDELQIGNALKAISALFTYLSRKSAILSLNSRLTLKSIILSFLPLSVSGQSLCGKWE